jgi:hypothetical protein
VRFQTNRFWQAMRMRLGIVFCHHQFLLFPSTEQGPSVAIGVSAWERRQG